VEIDADTADEAVVLLRLQLAVRALAAAERFHEMAVERATQRRQFGKVIGSFGAVQQRTATCQIDVALGTCRSPTRYAPRNTVCPTGCSRPRSPSVTVACLPSLPQ